MNTKIYLCVIIVSLLFMIPACFYDVGVLTVLSGIGCSGFAASIMAIYLENATQKKEKDRHQKARTTYFKNLNSQIVMLIERILWIDECMNDSNFNWNHDPMFYSSINYLLSDDYNSKNQNSETISFDEAINRLIGIGRKYNLEQQAQMSNDNIDKVQKMFFILASSSSQLISEVRKVAENKLILSSEEYISLSDIDELCTDISLSVGLMGNPKKNYEFAISKLIEAAKTIREIGNYTNNICIGLHFSVSISEL